MTRREPRRTPAPTDVDPNQAPGGQNKPRSQGGLAGRYTGDRNARRHPGYNTNKT